MNDSHFRDCLEQTPVKNFWSTIKESFTLMHQCTVTGLTVDDAVCIKKFLSVRWRSKKGDETLKSSTLNSATQGGGVLFYLKRHWIKQTTGL